MRIKTSRSFKIALVPFGEAAQVVPGDREYRNIDPADPFVRSQLCALVESGIISLEFDILAADKPFEKPQTAKAAPKPRASKKSSYSDGDED